MQHWVEGDVATAEIKLHYYRTGGAAEHMPPLVLVHGFTDNGLCWSRVAQALESEFDVVMLDARNHGKSGAGAPGHAAMAADIAAVIEQLHLRQPCVVGHSVGASVVASLAAHYPQLVGPVVLEDPPWREADAQNSSSRTASEKAQAGARKREEGFRAYVADMANKSKEQILALGREQHPSWDEADYPAWVQSKQQVQASAMDGLDLGDFRQLVPLIRVPSLLIYGDDQGDGIVTTALAQQVQALNSSFVSQQISGAGHNVRREGFADYMASIRSFLLSQR